MTTLLSPKEGIPSSGLTVVRWLKAEGQTFKKGDALLEGETQSGLVELQAAQSGILGRILAGVGKMVGPGAPLAELGSGDIAANATGLPRGGKSVEEQESESSPAGTSQREGLVTPILMPQAGQTMEEGTIVKWRVAEGARIKVGQVIFEVETDKAVVEVEAVDSGRLAKIVVPEGGTVPVKRPVAYLADNDEAIEAYLTYLNQNATGVAAPTGGESTSRAGGSNHEDLASAGPAVLAAEKGRLRASPAARKMARERGVDLSVIGAGSGPDGRILSVDVLAAQAHSNLENVADDRGAIRRKLDRMRKAIGANLQLSKQQIPHFYLRMTFDAGPMLAFYKAEKANYACSINDVITTACARTLAEFPAFRSRLEQDELVEFPGANIGIAVSLQAGLRVPVLVGAERMQLAEVAANTRRIVENARAGKLEGLGLGVFTISNLGMHGVEEFSAIINAPEAAILAVGAVRDVVQVKNGAIAAGQVVTVTLSCDHRIVDGVQAAKFLARLKDLLESPVVLRRPA